MCDVFMYAFLLTTYLSSLPGILKKREKNSSRKIDMCTEPLNFIRWGEKWAK
jgi:hypothetical protein